MFHLTKGISHESHLTFQKVFSTLYCRDPHLPKRHPNPFLAGLADLADSQESDSPTAGEPTFQEHLQIPRQYCTAYNTAASLIDAYDEKISIV